MEDTHRHHMVPLHGDHLHQRMDDAPALYDHQNVLALLASVEYPHIVQLEVGDADARVMRREVCAQVVHVAAPSAVDHKKVSVGENDYVIVDFKQGDKTVEGAYVSIDKVEGQAREKFLGSKAGDSFDVDVLASFSNETDRASMLRVKKEELSAMEPVWSATIVNAKTFVPAEESQETYDKIFGKDEVKSAEEFDSKAREQL